MLWLWTNRRPGRNPKLQKAPVKHKPTGGIFILTERGRYSAIKGVNKTCDYIDKTITFLDQNSRGHPT